MVRMRFFVQAVLLILTQIVVKIALSLHGDRLLSNYPMIISHDAATGEIDESRDHVVADWTRTQDKGLIAQLNCGSRSFDYRPYYDEDNMVVIAHHGGIKVHKPMDESVNEVLQWCENNREELVMFYISHYDGGDSCENETRKVLDKYNIYTLSECSLLSSMTFSTAVKLGSRSSGGSLIAVLECTDEKYDSEINCYGKDFVCYDSWPSDTTDVPWNNMKSYMKETTASLPSNSATLWMAQAHWQSTAGSITFGTLHNSSILEDERRSGMNRWVAESIADGAFPYLNLLELDYVCDYGPEVLKAINSYYLDK